MYRNDNDDEHIDWTLLLEDFIGIGRFIVKGDVSSTLFHELHLFVRPSGADDFAAVQLGQLDNESVNCVSFRGPVIL